MLPGSERNSVGLFELVLMSVLAGEYGLRKLWQVGYMGCLETHNPVYVSQCSIQSNAFGHIL